METSSSSRCGCSAVGWGADISALAGVGSLSKKAGVGALMTVGFSTESSYLRTRAGRGLSNVA